MIKYNNNTINDWFFSTDNIIKVYRNNAICYYKIDSSSPSGQTPCYAVVEDISQYSDTEFEDVFNKADEKWYKLNNLDEYEEYGVYGSGRNVTTYDGKLTIDDGYEYIYSGGSWVNVGEVSGSTIDTVWIDPPSTNNQNASFTVGHYWGEGYKMIMNVYLSGSYSGDYGSFWQANGHTPIELSFYSNGFYYDMHNPTSTTAPDVRTTDYDYRILRQNAFSNYENSQKIKITLTYGSFKAELEETGTVIYSSGSTRTGFSWYNGLYQVGLEIMNASNKCHTSRIQVYNTNDELVNDIKFVKNQGVTGSQEISAYDSVLNVTYNNTNSYTPSYHIVSESGGTEYPMYYPVIQDPPNNLVFSSMAEAEAYECPWVGMKATIDGDNYVFSGDSQSGYEWVLAPVDYTKEYLTFEPISSAVTFRNSTKQFQYSLDKGATWTTLTTANTVTVNVGQKLMVKGNFGAGSDNDNGNKFITSGGTWKAYGNVLSLLGSDNYTSTTAISNSQLINLFRDCTTLINVDNLKMPAYTAGSKAIRGMFRNCSGLVHVPSDLLSTFTAFTSDATAMGIFEGCTNLLESPIIPNMTVGSYGAYGMFLNCTSLTACTCLLTANNITGNKTKDLLNGVNTANGVFYKNPNTTWSSSAISNSKIPSGWSIQDYSG